MSAATSAVHSAPGDRPVITLERACFGYGEQEIVHGVDFQIRNGERVALLGPNGSGKSTLVRGLLGLNSHLSGLVEVFGEPLSGLSRKYRLGYVPQRHTLTTAVAATVQEVVATGRLPHQSLLARSTKKDKQIVADCLDKVGLADFSTHQVAHLSGGQHRRVLIARALAAQPEALIMDEPTAGVDARNQETLVEVLMRLADTGVTQLIVTHEVAVMAPLITRVISLRDGLVDFDGSPVDYQHQQLNEVAGHQHHHGPTPGGTRKPSTTGLRGSETRRDHRHESE